MGLTHLIIAAALLSPNCANVEEAMESIDTARYAGRLEEAMTAAAHLLECGSLDADERITLHLRLATMHDRVGLHRNTRPVEAALRQVLAAEAIARDASPRSRAAVEAAFAKYFYRAEMAGRKFERAEQHAREALRLYAALDDAAGRADAAHSLGLIHLQRGELEHAQMRFDESLRLEEKTHVPRPEMLADYHRHTAFVLVRSGTPELALPHFRKSFEQRLNGGLIDASIFAAISVGATLIELGRADEAAGILDYAVDTAISIDSPVGEARAIGALAEMHEQLDDKEAAAKAYERIRVIGAALGSQSMVEWADEALERIAY